MNIAELSFISILVIMVAFYLVLVRPSQQDQKRQQQTIRDLQLGDEVVTPSGCFARIKEIHTPEEGPVQLVLELGRGLAIAPSPARSPAGLPPQREHREASERCEACGPGSCWSSSSG